MNGFEYAYSLPHSIGTTFSSHVAAYWQPRRCCLDGYVVKGVGEPFATALESASEMEMLALPHGHWLLIGCVMVCVSHH